MRARSMTMTTMKIVTIILLKEQRQKIDDFDGLGLQIGSNFNSVRLCGRDYT